MVTEIDVLKIKPRIIALDSVILDRADNVRNPNSASEYNVEALILQLQGQGQLEPALLYPDGDNFRPLRGFRRLTALKAAQSQGLRYASNDVLTTDEEGNAVKLQTVVSPQCAGKLMDFVIARVVTEPLTPANKILLKLDHDSRVGLDLVGLQISVEQAFNAGLTEADVVLNLENMFRQYYPPKKNFIPVDPNKPGDDKRYRTDLLNYWKTVLQTMKSVWRSPTMLRDEWLEKLEGKHKWPKEAKMRFLSKTFQDEFNADNRTGLAQFSKDNPGPKFLAEWEIYKRELSDEEDEKSGKKDKIGYVWKPAELLERTGACRSRFIKIMTQYILGTRPWATFHQFDAAIAGLESGNADFATGINAIVGTGVAGGETPTPATDTDPTTIPGGDSAADTGAPDEIVVHQ